LKSIAKSINTPYHRVLFALGIRHVGETVAKIADLENFKVEAKISDIHAGKLVIGNPVKIRINETELSGVIYTIQPTIESGIVTFMIELQEKSNPLLRSNLRVDVQVILSSREGVIRVKNGPFINGSGKQEIFIIKGNKAFRTAVNKSINEMAVSK